MKKICSVNLDEDIYKEAQERLGKRKVSEHINEFLRQEMLSYSSEKIEKELIETKEKVIELERRLEATRLREARRRKYESAIQQIRIEYDKIKKTSYRPIAWNEYSERRLREMGVGKYVI